MRLVLVLAWVAACVLLVPSASGAQKPLVRRDLGFSCVLPKGYKDVGAQVKQRSHRKEKPALAVVRTFAPKEYAAISLMVRSSGGRFLRTYLPLDKHLVRDMPGAVVRDKAFVRVGGKHALRYTVQLNRGKRSMVRRYVAVITNGLAYRFVFIASPSRYKANAPDFDRMMASVRWLTPARSTLSTHSR